MPSRALAARQAVTSTTESPKRTMTEPPACLASLPVSKLRGTVAECEFARCHRNANSAC